MKRGTRIRSGTVNSVKGKGKHTSALAGRISASLPINVEVFGNAIALNEPPPCGLR